MKYAWLILLAVTRAFGFVSDGLHKPQDYAALAQNPAFESACLVLCSQKGIQQTGVLIAPDLVATAAHGMVEAVESLPDKSIAGSNVIVQVTDVSVTFRVNGKLMTAEADAVLIDGRYLNNPRHEAAKYDMAYIRLKNPVTSVTPARLLSQATIPDDTHLTVVTFSTIDMIIKPAQPYPRAFMLYEMDYFHPLTTMEGMEQEFQSLLMSSIFFNPDTVTSAPDIDADELTHRIWGAKHNMLKDPKPYGLALPGTSGAPVFARLNGEYWLLGLVTSFAGTQHNPAYPLDVNMLLSTKPVKIQNNYQTVFALFYRKDTDPSRQEAHSFSLVMDPRVKTAVSLIRGGFPA